MLDAELGLEPGVELRDLQTAVLRQDPALAWARPRGVATVAGRAARRRPAAPAVGTARLPRPSRPGRWSAATTSSPA